MSEESGEKEFEPTQRRLDEARAKGDIARSVDVTTGAVYVGMLLAGMVIGGKLLTDFSANLAGVLGRAGEIRLADMTPALFHLVISAFGPFGLIVVPAGIVMLALFAQRAIVLAPERIAPKLSRLSIVSNARNKFGRAGLFDFSKSAAKLLIYSGVLGWHLAAHRGELLAAISQDAGQIGAGMFLQVIDLMKIVAVVAALIGLGDLMWQRAEHRRKLMMTRDEMREEMKQSEGDPAIKAQRRQKAIAIATSRMLQDVPKADVVIVNPTHYAVALRWERTKGGAPVCVAKGVDEVAARIREAAQTHGVPIRSDPPTARALHATVRIGHEVDRDHYRAVAAAIRFADAMRRKAKS